MKKLILLLFIPLVFACSSDDSSDDNTNPTDDTNPVYLDSNGVTIKARDWAVVGDSGVINGVAYTIVNSSTLREMIENGDDVTRVCTSRITDMSNLFLYKQTFNLNISTWDVSNVTNMNHMFFRAENFNQDISNWDVSSVTNMAQMFNLAFAFNQDISSWDVSSVDDMMNMFADAISFNQDISMWNVGIVINMSRMFDNANTFNQDLSGWDVNNATMCLGFCDNTTDWTLPKPNFTNCLDYDELVCN